MMVAHTKQFDYRLSDLLQNINFEQYYNSWPELENIVVNGITDDSREVVLGDLFIARSGTQLDGQNFILDAIRCGANAVLYTSDSKDNNVKWEIFENKQIPIISIPGLEQKIGSIASSYNNHASKEIDITGITGTNGKTTCAYMLSCILDKCGFIGTLGTGFIDKLTVSTNTTPGVLMNHRIIGDLYGQGAKNLVMEVSSHAMQQGRIDAIDVNCAVFTNLTHEHLDYHGTMQQYGNEKLKLFQLKSLQYAVINSDDCFADRILDVLTDKVRIITYSVNPTNTTATLRAENINYSIHGVELTIQTPWGAENIFLPVLGTFNISNCLAILAVLLHKKIPLSKAVKLLTKIKPIPGRMQQLGGKNQQPLVVVDYAHTPDALQQVLQTLAKHCLGKLWCVFGCGGDRDISKRPIMGKIASELSDHVLITDDNPRTENSQNISNEIISGIENKNNILVIHDRKKAISTALSNATYNDIVLIAGKGHEDYQLVNNEKLKFSDINIAAAILQGDC